MSGCGGGTPTGSRSDSNLPTSCWSNSSTAGVVGLVGFVVLMAGALVVLWRIDPAYGVVAVAVLVNRLVQGQLDLFWVAVQTSLPFLVVGIALGALARDEPTRLPDVGEARDPVGGHQAPS